MGFIPVLSLLSLHAEVTVLYIGRMGAIVIAICTDFFRGVNTLGI